MSGRVIKIWLVFACLFFVTGSSLGLDVNSVDESIAKAAVISCKGMIDDGLFQSIKRRSELAIEAGADYLIYEIQTYGGLLKAGDDISKYFILEISKKAHTVAYVTTEAISAGAMVSVSCQDIIMLENTTIGDCAPIQMGGKLEGVEREKVESFTRAAFIRAAEANRYPAALLKAMVTMHIEVYRVRNLQTDEYEFFETDDLPSDPNQYDIKAKVRIVKDDELLTLTASQAFEYGIAREVVADRGQALAFLAQRDGVRFVDEPMVMEPLWSEQMVRWINSPAVMGILVMLAMLGVYLELNTPGVGLPGLVAVICFTIIIGSKYLIGLANWVEVALFITGILLLMVEIFVLPGFGIAGVMGITCVMVGLFGMLIKNAPDQIPWPQTDFDWRLFNDGVMGIFFGFVGFSVLAWAVSKFLPKMSFLSGLLLVPAVAKSGDEVEVSMTAPLESSNVALSIGDVGEVVSPLRPTGKAKFGQARVDVVAVAEFVDKGSSVEIIEIHGNRVVVRAKRQS